MAVRLSKKMHAALSLARFATDHNLKPYDVAVLITLAHRAFNAGERHANGVGDDKKAAERFEDKARELGFGVEWSGLWPTLKDKDNRDVTLPSMD